MCAATIGLLNMTNILYFDPVASFFLNVVNSQISEVRLDAKLVRFVSFLKAKINTTI